jgi:hypothetical protein
MAINKILKEDFLNLKFGKLQLIDENLPNLLTKGSHKEYNFKCDCGNIPKLVLREVLSGHRTSCGKCTAKPKQYFLLKKFGKLELVDKELPELISPGSYKIFTFKCDCGNLCKKVFGLVIRGHLISCGGCNKKSKDYWLSQKFGKLILVNNNLPENISPYTNSKFLFKCDCGKVNNIRFYDVTFGKSTSCGCGMDFPGRVSKISKVIFEKLKSYIPTLLFSVQNVLKRKEIDFYFPQNKIAIEYNGLRWHSGKTKIKSRLFTDYEKYLELKNLGIRYIGIFSDEWQNHKDLFLNLILNACNVTKNAKRIYSFEIKEVSQNEFQTYHDKWHYLSGRKVTASIYLLAYYKDTPIGGWSFKKINETTLDWNRAFWNHNFKAWNPHEKALQYAINKFDCNSVITFSDNRLFDGSMYSKLGFENVKELQPDYEYTDGNVRKHKFNFRVKAGVDEEVEAKKKGFYRVYDCGKIKWKLNTLDSIKEN